MFGRWWKKKKQRYGPENPYPWEETPLLVPAFIPDQKMEALAAEIARRGAHVSGTILDGSEEDRRVAAAELRDAEKKAVERGLLLYLRPYLACELPNELGPTRVHPSEYNRVYAALQLKEYSK